MNPAAPPTSTPAVHWLDTFDLDLPRHLPLVDLLGDLAPLPLYTRGHANGGETMIAASVWNGWTGLPATPVSFYGLDPSGDWLPAGYTTGHPVVETSALLAFRLTWGGCYTMIVNNKMVFNAYRHREAFHELLGHVRRYAPLGPVRAEALWETVRADIVTAVTRLRGLAAG